MLECYKCIHQGEPAREAVPDPLPADASAEDLTARIKELSDRLLSHDEQPLVHLCAKQEEKVPFEGCDVGEPIDFDKWIPVGSFKTIGTLRATDPCYGLDVWCAGDLNAVPGTWHAAVKHSDEDTWGIRTAALMVWHESLGADPFDSEDWVKTPIDGGVDSGQFGFIDKTKFKGREADEEEYRRICDGTHKDAYVTANGVFSRTGYGDGSYPVSVLTELKLGAVTAAKVVFIGEDEEDEEDEDEEEYQLEVV